MMRVFGVFGDPIEHSLSPSMHNAAFRALGIKGCYHAFRVSRPRLADAIYGAAAMGFGGLNLTIPLKEEALRLESLEVDDLAREIGAVNTISFSADKGEGGAEYRIRIQGHNTDGRGALLALQGAGVRVRGSRVLIIGAGGAARALAYSLDREGAEISIANRRVQRAHDLAASVGGTGFSLSDLDRLVSQADVIINATSVGMREGDGRIIDGHLLKSHHAVFDIVYNRETELISDARSAGAVAIDGVMMLVYQGAEAFEIWMGRRAPVDVMERAVRERLEKRRRDEVGG
ncbi:shikimate dehydrogenase [Methanothrix sp.]|uniref:shikimate dehydrogenase n=1 Tax=Methanothrix sp. TaxID=90426 RepID=UPI003C734CF6